ncbi:unnamed protein product, partial [Urochloa humidicola]
APPGAGRCSCQKPLRGSDAAVATIPSSRPKLGVAGDGGRRAEMAAELTARIESSEHGIPTAWPRFRRHRGIESNRALRRHDLHLGQDAARTGSSAHHDPASPLPAATGQIEAASRRSCLAATPRGEAGTVPPRLGRSRGGLPQARAASPAVAALSSGR